MKTNWIENKDELWARWGVWVQVGGHIWNQLRMQVKDLIRNEN